jgi:diguanylate cyclase (GGDEF)-like protein
MSWDTRLPILNPDVLKQILGTSLVFRLWLALSVVGTLFAAGALAAFVLLSVNDDVNAAHRSTLDKATVVLGAMSRLSKDGVTPSTADTAVGRSLGLRKLELIAPNGSVSPASLPDAPASTEPAIDAEMARKALAGQTAQRQLVVSDTGFKGSVISPVDVLRGGSYAEEFVFPLNIPTSPNAAAVRMVIDYPDLTAGSHTLVGRVAWVGLVLLTASLVGMWLFLRHFVSRPLHRYSQLALRIAGGDPVRMPATGGSELAELGRALNGMADALNTQATVDSLTGLYNLRHLSSNLESLIADAKRDQRPLSLIVGDLDNLKPVNDTFGHSAGDRLLQEVSNAVRDWSGPQFTCWRLGGEEFVVALPRINSEEALGHAADLRTRIASIQLPASGLRASISVGVATYPMDGENAGTLLNAADRRMYALKALRAEERRIATARIAA